MFSVELFVGGGIMKGVRFLENGDSTIDAFAVTGGSRHMMVPRMIGAGACGRRILRRRALAKKIAEVQRRIVDIEVEVHVCVGLSCLEAPGVVLVAPDTVNEVLVGPSKSIGRGTLPVRY